MIDTAMNAVSATIAVSANPIGAAVTPNGSRAHVTNDADGSVNVIDTAPSRAALTPNGLSSHVSVPDTPHPAP